MDSTAVAGMGGVMVVLALLGVVLAIAWILLPFAMFGMKPLLRELIAETKRTNALLQEVKMAAGVAPVSPSTRVGQPARS
jgi:hypothetical protein